ncbi:MAG: VacB/RNase II family 3'-5' exoribonuclease [Clostridia bacterium]|nr:VacB/RNase II family 3'-5' exoribonuclease [Clostridia bacterium]
MEEILSGINSTGVSYGGVKLRDVSDSGRGARRGAYARRDELCSRGVYRGSRYGYGFVTAEELSDDIFIPQGSVGDAIDGDLVEVIYHPYIKDGQEKYEGRVTKIAELGRTSILGTVCRMKRGYGKKAKSVYVIEPDDSKISILPEIRELGDALVGDRVEAKLIRGGYRIICDVVKSFGDARYFDSGYDAVLAEFGIEKEFSPEALAEAQRAAAMAVTADGRLDLREETIFTIDGADAKDLDDAISLRRVKGGWRLGVHIADVSYYVGEKTALERAAMSRGTSVYFADMVVPMLPTALSNGACSLNAGEDKYAISVYIRLDSEGKITDSEIFPSVIRSCVRGVYSEVNAILDGTADGEILQKYKRVLSTLGKMHELYKLLAKNAQARGALELEGDEAKIIIDSSGMPTNIIRRERGDGEKLIEQFMLAANEAVARKLTDSAIPCVYRIHENPPMDKCESLILFLTGLGLDTRGIMKGGEVILTALSRVLDEAEEKGLYAQVSHVMLRSMSKAKYSEIKAAHFGLGLDTYCHFTSPIRRLSDLATHRIIRRVLFEGKRAESYKAFAKRAASAASESELRAIAAERRIDDMFKALYMSQFIGDSFEATVSSVTGFGIFAELPNTCEGLIPLLSMPAPAIFDEKSHTLRSGGRIYRLADPITVRVEECDELRGKITFSLVRDEYAEKTH